MPERIRKSRVLCVCCIMPICMLWMHDLFSLRAEYFLCNISNMLKIADAFGDAIAQSIDRFKCACGGSPQSERQRTLLKSMDGEQNNGTMSHFDHRIDGDVTRIQHTDGHLKSARASER